MIMSEEKLKAGDGFEYQKFSFTLGIYLPIIIVLFAIIEGIGVVWRPLGAFFYLIIFGTATFMLYGISLSNDDDVIYPSDEEWSFTFLIFLIFATLVSFTQLCRYYYMGFGGFFANNSNYWHWMRFGVQNLLESLLFDIPAIYKWQLTEIEASSFFSRALIVLFRVTLEFIVVVQILRGAKLVRSTWVKTKAELHGNYLEYIIKEIGRLITFALWAFPLYIFIDALQNDGISLERFMQVSKFVLNTLLGFWFTWTNLKAILLAGGWNKFFAFLGFIVGVLWMTLIIW